MDGGGVSFLAAPEPTFCVVMRSVHQLNDLEREEAEIALKDPSVAALRISDAFKKRGLGGRDQAVTKHREGLCCCS